MFKRPQLTLTDFNNRKLDEFETSRKDSKPTLSDYELCISCDIRGIKTHIPLSDFKPGQACPICGECMMWARAEIKPK